MLSDEPWTMIDIMESGALTPAYREYGIGASPHLSAQAKFVLEM